MTIKFHGIAWDASYYVNVNWSPGGHPTSGYCVKDHMLFYRCIDLYYCYVVNSYVT